MVRQRLSTPEVACSASSLQRTTRFQDLCVPAKIGFMNRLVLPEQTRSDFVDIGIKVSNRARRRRNPYPLSRDRRSDFDNRERRSNGFRNNVIPAQKLQES